MVLDGSMVNKEGIEQQLDAFQKEGLGGVNISATYAVKGFEKQSIPFMSPKWVDMVNYTGALQPGKVWR